MAYNNIYNKKIQNNLAKSLGFLDIGKKNTLKKANSQAATARERLKSSLLRHTGGMSGAIAQSLAKANSQALSTIGNIGLKYDINKANQANAINQFLSNQYNQNYNLAENRKLSKEQLAQQAKQFAERLKFQKKQYEESKPKWYDYLLAGLNSITGRGGSGGNNDSSLLSYLTQFL